MASEGDPLDPKLNPATTADSAKQERNELVHWICVLGGAVYFENAVAWRDRKIAGGKCYEVLWPCPGASQSVRFEQMAHNDVLYLYGPMSDTSPFRLGEPPMDPEMLAAWLVQQGLSPSHGTLKVFASRSADPDLESGGASFAERLHAALHPNFPEISVFGYRGEVNPNGPGSSKTAGLGPGEDPASLPVELWSTRNLRAKDNRVRYGAQREIPE